MAELIKRPSTREEFRDMVASVEKEYEEEVNDAIRRRNGRMEDIESRWQEMSQEPLGKQKRSRASIVREMISGFDQDFTVKDVQYTLREYHPYVYSNTHPSSISGILSRMRREGKVEVVERGSGPQPTVYSAVTS